MSIDNEKKFTMMMRHFEFEGDAIPEGGQGALMRYFVHRISPGSFLRSVLENDLMGAFGMADDVNIRRVHVYAAFLYQHAPRGSYGSPEAVASWMREGVDRG